MKKCRGGIVLLALGIMAISLSACATYKTTYRSELTQNPKCEEANISYKKALHWIHEGDAVPEPERAAQNYDLAESCLTDTIFKLQQIGNKNDIDVSGDVYYCEQMQRETHAKKGTARRATGPQ
ncbi:MAG: hypothetical protein WCG78_08590 [Candidatus Omnitrophota bacterium]